MIAHWSPFVRTMIVTVLAVGVLTGCQPQEKTTDAAWLEDFATRYAAAWCSQDPAAVAAFFAEDGSLTINDGEPSVGRQAIAEAARKFMAAYPDMVVAMDGVELEGSAAVFRWTFTGTDSGPGGTGNAVRISGYEEWTLGDDGLVAQSLGYYDQADWNRQLKAGGAGE